MNTTSTVTAAFSTSFAASPTQFSIYTKKKNALASPAKGGAKSSKNIVNLSGKAGGAAWILPVEAINSKLLP